MSIHIIEAGILDTIQDMGRFGYGASGINTNGCMDIVAACAANYLVGNDEKDAVIEMHFPAATIKFTEAGLIAITGADFSPEINGALIPMNTAVFVPSQSVLQFKKIKSRARLYLALRGGFDLPRWLNSYSTNLKAKAGGSNGRSLQKGDVLKYNTLFSFAEGVGARSLSWHADTTDLYGNDNLVRVIKGNDYSLLTECSETILGGNTFIISTQSDRMGYRLSGSPLRSQEQSQMISSAVTKGTVQLLPNGQLIILMADHQTTGGYPRIGHVITADTPKLAQMQINTSIRFQLVSIAEAELLMLQQYHHLQQLKNACTFRLSEFLKQHAVN